MALSLDQHSNATANSASTTGVASSITTTLDDDIIVAMFWGRASSTAATVSSVSGGGLTWTRRFTHSVNMNADQQTTPDHCILEVWWAHQTTHGAITVTPTYTQNIARNYTAVWGVNGCHLASPWDSDPSLPSIVDDNTATLTDPHNVTFSTTHANCFLIGGLVDDLGNGGQNSADTGWTLITEGFNNAGSGMSISTEEKIVSAAQSSVTQNVFHLDQNSISYWVAFVDALTSDSNDATSTIDQTLTGITQLLNATSHVPDPTTIAQTLPGITQLLNATSFVPITATWHSTEAKDIFNGVVFVPPSGTWHSTEAQDIFGFSGAPTPPLSVDAHASGGSHGGSGAGTTSATVTITTSFPHEVIVLGIHSGGFWHQGAVTSVTDTAGLVWNRRNQRQVIQSHLNGTTDSWVEEWWAHKPTTGATTITVNTDPTGALAIEAIAVAGANVAAPFDTHTGAGMIVDNYTGDVIDPAGRGHFGNPAVLLYTDSVKTLTLAWHASPDNQADTSVPTGFTFLDRTEQDEGSGNTLYLASMYKVEATQQFGTTDVWFGPDATHISNRYLIVDSIVAADESTSTNDLVRWYFDGLGNRTIIQFGTGQTSTSFNVVNFRENALMVVAVMTLTGSNSRVDHISDAGNHSGWERRSIVTDSSGAVCMEVWWVKMADALSGDITINMDSQIQNGDFVSAIAFAIHGTDSFQRGEIWDHNGSLPATAHSTAGLQEVGPFDTSNDNVLVLSFGANIDTTLNDTDLTGKNVLPFLQFPAPGELVSDGPPSFHIALDYKFSGPVVSSATAEFDLSPAAQSWLMIADAVPVGPVSPPHGTLAANEHRDTFTHNGDFTAIGIASPGGWVGFPPNHATLAATDAKDKNGNSGAFTAIWAKTEGWIAFVPAFEAWASVEHKDTYHNGGWILGPRTIIGHMHAGEAPDRLAFSNRGPAVTGTMHPTERKDNLSANMLAIPTATPIPARKRQLLIVT